MTVAALAGGMAWLAKLSVIAVTDGEVTDTGLAAVFYFAGLAAILLASTGVGVRLAGRRPLPVAVVLALLSPVAAFMVFGLLDEAAQSLVGDAGPAWLQDEAGILAMALVALAAGATAWRATPRAARR